ncbi:MAG: ATP-binding protein [Ilumatobacteraceae bacterium]
MHGRPRLRQLRRHRSRRRTGDRLPTACLTSASGVRTVGPLCQCSRRQRCGSEVDFVDRDETLRQCHVGVTNTEQNGGEQNLLWIRAVDRFWRSTTTTKAGSGIGLSIVRRLVEVNDGDIRLESRPGGGLVARVQLPISRQ